MNGTQQEPLPILTLAKELNIDSIKAYLYWSTGFAVKCAHLNGEDSLEYHPVQLFSGRQGLYFLFKSMNLKFFFLVMGLTLDVDSKFVYWIVRGSEGSNLFRAPMAGYSTNIQAVKVSSLQKPNMQGPLCYFHKRLLWLQNDRNAAISDLQGKNIAAISGTSMSDLTLVSVVDSSLHLMPETSSGKEIVVIPEKVNKHTVHVLGSLKSFNVSWVPVKNINYGTVFYEVNVESSQKNGTTVITSLPTVKYWQPVAPFTKLHVTIRAFTYWGASPQIRATINSPSSTPSVPKNLRGFSTHQHNNRDDGNDVIVSFRWDPPMFPNGVIEGYKVHCWYFDGQEKINVCQNVVNATLNQVDIKSFGRDVVYFFNVSSL